MTRIRASAARKAAGKHKRFVPYEDMMQQAQLATLEKPGKTHQHVSNGDGVRLFSLIYKFCDAYGQKQKAAAIGYRTDDLFFYSKRVLRFVIPAVLEYWSGDQEAQEDVPDTTMWVDVSEALRGLSEAEYQMIWWSFKGDPDQDSGAQNVADNLGISLGAARGRVDRLLRKIQESLGGEPPNPRRKTKSNAASMAETREAWNGEA